MILCLVWKTLPWFVTQKGKQYERASPTTTQTTTAGARAHAGLLHKAVAVGQCQGRGVTGVAAAQCRRESHRRSVRARDVTPERQPASAHKPGVNSKC